MEVNDLISRQAAVAEIEKPHDINLGALPTGNRSFEDIWRCVAVAYEKGIAHAVKVLGALPSAHPEYVFELGRPYSLKGFELSVWKDEYGGDMVEIRKAEGYLSP